MKLLDAVINLSKVLEDGRLMLVAWTCFLALALAVLLVVRLLLGPGWQRRRAQARQQWHAVQQHQHWRVDVPHPAPPVSPPRRPHGRP